MKELISFADWMKIDARLGTIVEASEPEWSEKLIELHVDFGQEVGMKTIFTALRAWKTAADFQGKQSLFLINLPPKKMGEHFSEGMILALDNAYGTSNSEPIVLLFDDIAPAGSSLH